MLRPRLAALLAAFMAMAGFALGTGLVAVGGAGRNAGPAHVAAEEPATSTDQGSDPANNSPLLVTDPTEPRFVVLANRLDAPDFGCALQVSGDGGLTWAPAQPVPHLPAGADKCYAPEVAFDRGGVLYYLFVGLAGRGNQPVGAFLVSSADRAASFSAPRRVLGPHNFSVRMAIDPTLARSGRIHLVWLHAGSPPALGGFIPPSNPILAAHSDDGGRTFSSPVQVNAAERQRVVAPALALGPHHGVHVAFYDLGADAVDYQGLEGPIFDGTWSVVVATAPGAGSQFSRQVVVDDKVVPSARVMLVFTMPPPTLAVARGRMCVGWTDARLGDDDAMARCSPDAGRRWAALRRLNDDPKGNGVSQYLPRLSIAPNGRVDAVFYDRRVSPANLSATVSYTWSADGRRFAPNVALARDPSDVRIGQQYANVSADGLFEFGSRLGLVSRAGGAVAAWADTRNSNQRSTGQDIFVAQVGLVQLPTPGWARIAGAVLVAVACLAAWVLVRRPRAAA